MKKMAFVLPILMVAPLSAQSWEVGVFYGQQTYKSFSVSGEGVLDFKVDDKSAYGLRVGKSFFDSGPFLFQVTAGIQPQVTSTAKATVDGAPFGSGDYKSQNYSLGAMFNFNVGVSLGAAWSTGSRSSR